MNPSVRPSAPALFDTAPPVCAICKHEITGTPILIRPEDGSPVKVFCPVCYWKVKG